MDRYTAVAVPSPGYPPYSVSDEPVTSTFVTTFDLLRGVDVRVVIVEHDGFPCLACCAGVTHG